MHRHRTALLTLAVVTALAGCGNPDPVSAPQPPYGLADTDTSPDADRTQATDPSGGEEHPDILEAELTDNGDGTHRMAATIASPYDTPERYADAFRVLTPDGQELTVRVLTHDHADEQPFTRSSADFEIPAGVTELTVEGRDQVSSWGGATVQVPVPG